MSAASRQYPRTVDELSFMRRATKVEREAAAQPIIYWSVEPSGSYSEDIARGKAAAEELMEFLLAAPTNGNLTLPSMILLDMMRVVGPKQGGFLMGFGSVIGKFAFIGATVAGADAIRRDEESRKRELIRDLHAQEDHALADAFEGGRLT